MNENTRYDAANIQVLKDLEAVRRRPSMYIGDTDKRGLHHLIFEVVDNAVDEAQEGYCDKIEVIIGKDNTVTVTDNGRGIPVDIHPDQKKPGVEVIMTMLHAGSKFDHKIYKISGGLHGVGVSVVNAISEYLEVEITRDNTVYHQRYERGKVVSNLKIINKDKSLQTGTKVTFLPDPEIFPEIQYSFDIITEKLRELAFLNKGLTVKLFDERTEKTRTFLYNGGIVEFIEFLDKDKGTIHKPIYFCAQKEDSACEIALQYTDFYTENIFTFANNINTKEGGTHLAGFKAGITRAVNDYGRKSGLLKDISLTGDDAREGITSIVAVKIREPQFEGQTKTKLGNSEVRGMVESLVYNKLGQYFEENPSTADKIIKKIMVAASSRVAAAKARELTRQKAVLGTSPLPGKLADCEERNPENREIYIVEGDSAGGSAKQGRDRKFQAILPLRGKILNVEKAREDKILSNEEIKNIISALGIRSTLRYHKIIIMTDADVDGAHIRTLLLTFFYRYAKDIVENSHLYIAQPPLYRVKQKRKVMYVYSDEELNTLTEKLEKDGIEIQRYKGLGEMNPDELYNTTMDIEKRTIKLVTLEDIVEADKTFTMLMGDKVEPRRQFIEQNAKYVENLDI